jgi:hypothetical protein
MTRWGTCGRAATAAVVLAGLASCSAGAPGPPLGQQLVAGRDVSNVFFWTDRSLGFTRAAADPAAGGPQDLWVSSLDPPAPELALAGVDWPRGPSFQYREGELLVTGDGRTRLYDVGRRLSANLATDFTPPAGGGDVLLFDGEPMRPFTLLRSDGGAIVTNLRGTSDTLIFGRPPDLKTFAIPDDGHVGAAAFLGADLALLLMTTVDGKQVVGIHRLDAVSGALTTLVAPAPAENFVGVTGFCEARSGPSCGYFRSFGCAVNEPPCPDGSAPSCLVVYTTLDPAGSGATVTFSHDVSRGVTRSLLGRNHDHMDYNDRSHLLVWGSTFELTTNHTSTCGDVGMRQCPFSPGDVLVWRPDGEAFAPWDIAGSFTIVSPTPFSCEVVPPDTNVGVRQLAWSPQGDRLMWISEAAGGGHTLWAAGPLGESPSVLASGGFLRKWLSPDGRRVFLWRATSLEMGATASLTWMDLTAATRVENILSTNYYDGVFGNRRILITDHWNTQDSTGELMLVDPATGARTSLARAVSEFAVGGDVDAADTNLAYAVRNRAASPRDGLWLATLPP